MPNSKAAFKQQAYHLATHLKGTGIRVNQIAPGVFPSEMTAGDSDEKQKSELISKIGNTAGRGGSDAEMAATLLYLAGPGGLFCNGQIMYPDVRFSIMRWNRSANSALQGGQMLVAPSVI